MKYVNITNNNYSAYAIFNVHDYLMFITIYLFKINLYRMIV